MSTFHSLLLDMRMKKRKVCLSDFKSPEFGQKSNCSKVEICKDGVLESFVAKYFNIKEKPSILVHNDTNNPYGYGKNPNDYSTL